jgi:hydroxymethylbilane synthase
MPSHILRLGTRSSRLAQWQTRCIAAALRRRHGLACEEVPIVTAGDRDRETPLPEIGGKGLFTEALEQALLSEAIDLAVHSLKDLPLAERPGLVVAAICFRADPRDVVISRTRVGLDALPAGARVGTSSTRRAAQLRMARGDLVLVPLRGNVDTRVRRALAGDYDAVVIAAAGVERLGLADAVSEYLPLERMLPAPGQGALAVQCRSDDSAVLKLVTALDDPAVRAAVEAERAFLAGVGGGCAAPVAAHAGEGSTDAIRLHGLVAAVDGSRAVHVEGEGPRSDARGLGSRLAERALAQGAAELLTE